MWIGKNWVDVYETISKGSSVLWIKESEEGIREVAVQRYRQIMLNMARSQNKYSALDRNENALGKERMGHRNERTQKGATLYKESVTCSK